MQFLSAGEVSGGITSEVVTQRIDGENRIATSIAVSQQGWKASETVILNEYSNYSDALSSTPLAVQLDAPVLLTSGDQLDSRIVSELQRLQAKKVILLGGVGRLGTVIECELTALNYQWERIGGLTRYETAALIAEKIPILLTSKSVFPESVKKYYQKHNSPHVIVVGGNSVVPDQLLAKHDIPVEIRLGGIDRYSTAAKLYNYAKSDFSSQEIYLASGEQYPDAMVGTVLAAKNNSHLLITKGNYLPPSITQLLSSMKGSVAKAWLLGGTGVVSQNIEAELSSLLKDELPQNNEEQQPPLIEEQNPVKDVLKGKR